MFLAAWVCAYHVILRPLGQWPNSTSLCVILERSSQRWIRLGELTLLRPDQFFTIKCARLLLACGKPSINDHRTALVAFFRVQATKCSLRQWSQEASHESRVVQCL